jgi:hypothetical protein
MTRQRLRPAHTPERLAEIYATPHDHRRFPDHILRVDATIALAQWLAGSGVRRAADLSCGNGAVLAAVPAKARIFGDFAPGYEMTGPLEETLPQLDPVDLYVCAETLEHLDDPDKVLALIRAKTNAFVLSTPVEAWDDDNEEHYWAWSREDVEAMLAAAGFDVGVYSSVDFRPLGLPYCFGIWGCR